MFCLLNIIRGSNTGVEVLEERSRNADDRYLEY